MCQKNCAECIHAAIGQDMSVGIYPHLEDCNAPLSDEVCQKGDEIEWAEDKMPEICGHFTPHMVAKCGVCGKEMNAPRYTVKLWTVLGLYGDSVPCCSEECVTAGKVRYELESREEARYRLQ